MELFVEFVISVVFDGEVMLLSVELFVISVVFCVVVFVEFELLELFEVLFEVELELFVSFVVEF